MLFRPYLLGMIALITVSLLEKVSVQAQPTLPLTAWKDPQNAEAVSGWANGVLRRIRDAAGTSREELFVKTLSELKEIVADTDIVHSTRYIAILVAGQLVSVPSPGNPPVAYPDVLSYLIEVYQKPDVPDYLKYGALLGIVRHAAIGIAPDRQGEVIDLLLDTIMTEFEAGEVTLDTAPLESAAWDWFRLTALDGLTPLKTVGINGKVVTELLAVIDRKSQELEELIDIPKMFTREEWEWTHRSSTLAFKAAKTLGDLNYSSATDIDAQKMTDTFIRLINVVCGINSKIATDSIERGGNSPNPVLLLERIVINVKMGAQSVCWGIRGGFLPVYLTTRPAENSLYASLKSDDLAIKRLDGLLAEIIKLSTFLDEGDGTKQLVLAANVPKEFLFTLSELRDVLAKISETLMEM